MQVTFPGTGKEREALLLAIGRNCTCDYSDEGACVSTCASHAMLVHDQRSLDGLVFMRRMADCLRRGEFR